ncbi:hypothetical protein PRIC2_011893 [Phytophthora ramorum]
MVGSSKLPQKIASNGHLATSRCKIAIGNQPTRFVEELLTFGFALLQHKSTSPSKRDQTMAKWWFVAVLTALVVTPSVVLGACPNKCSGHGRCGLNDVCDCMQNWVGGDCSGRQCPFTRAWQDTAQRKDDAHYSAECGNRGTCDRTIGECSCDAGFVGSGCRRMQCPNDCSGHGTCEFIEELASDTYHKQIKGTAGTTYQLWDQEKIMGCVCDGGFEGHDCSLRTCPKGDDPLTPNQYDMIQAIVIDQPGGEGYLTYHDPYGNIYTTEKITFGAFAANTATCSSIQTALNRLPNNVLNNVQVSVAARFYAFTRTDPTDVLGSGTVNKIFMNTAGNAEPSATLASPPRQKTICQVEYTSEAGTTGYQNLLRCNILAHNDPNGQHPMTAGVTNAVATSCKIYEVYPLAVNWPPIDILPPAVGATPAGDGIPENQLIEGQAAFRPLTELSECAGRGTCDYSTGTCTCFAGHMGLACQKQEALV